MKVSTMISAVAIVLIGIPGIALAFGPYAASPSIDRGTVDSPDFDLRGVGDSLRLAQATPAPTLPGGASSIQETYGSWQITCVQQPGGRVCSMLQQQSDPQTGQRRLALEFTSVSGESSSGVLLLPFGLAVSEGVRLAIGAQDPINLTISTCLPVGCIARLEFDTETMDALRQSSEARITGRSDDGTEVSFAVPLDGFTSAAARLLQHAEQ